MDKFRHTAQRDTMWVGKSGPAAWLMIAGVVAGAMLLAALLH